jgi:hypothetical protein
VERQAAGRANPDGPVQQLVFGSGGYGLVTYLIMERDRRVDMLEVQWAGELPALRQNSSQVW